MIGRADPDAGLQEAEIRALVEAALQREALAGRRVLVIIPDNTRTTPMPLFFRLFRDLLTDGEPAGRTVAALDFLIALGTHPLMDWAAVQKWIGHPLDRWHPGMAAGYVGQSALYSHRWDQPETFTTIGTISADEVEAISAGLLREAVDIGVNRRIFDYDHLLLCAPTFPHEVAGFSGGNKYFFPGIGSAELINLTHWLGALLTSHQLIGVKDTPVRRLIDRAAALIPLPKLCFSMVVRPGGADLAGLFIGTPEKAFAAAADLSRALHIRWFDHPFQRALVLIPDRYADLWTAGKGMYKVEPVIADGGEVVLYAPHIREVSYSHGRFIDQVGYHTRDYFLKQQGKEAVRQPAVVRQPFAHIPKGVLAHSSHVRGLGSYDEEHDVEAPRINLTLASGISRERCQRLNLGYRDPATIHRDEWANREDKGVLLVPDAGEILYRLREPEGHWHEAPTMSPHK